jgi:hypothetical protein
MKRIRGWHTEGALFHLALLKWLLAAGLKAALPCKALQSGRGRSE